MSKDFSEEGGRSYDVLLVEPDPDSVSPFIESFEATDVTNEVAVVTSGDEAFDFIHRRDTYADAPRPDLVLLDLHVPDTSGFDLIAAFKDRPELRQIPVLVVTASNETADIARSYELHANAYLQKPESSDGFDKLVRRIEDFWFELVKFPPKGD